MSDIAYRAIQPGDPAPQFIQETSGGPKMVFDFLGGKYTVLCFFATTADARGQQMLQVLERGRALFDGNRVFVGVGIDRRDPGIGRLKGEMPGIHFLRDFDYSVSKLYGIVPENQSTGSISLRRRYIVLDPNLRIRAVFEPEGDGAEVDKILAYVSALPPVDQFPGFHIQAPIIVLPNVFEPDFCRQLIDLHNSGNARETGFMRDVDGKTVEILDPRHKRRTDYHVEDENLQAIIQQKLARRVVPEIKKIHQFDVTRMERFLIGCYDSETGGHFGAHRDNTTMGTAHRRFAVSINLNSEFDGGEVGFPEYGPQTFKPPAGGAVVFSCSLLHWVSEVKRGKRYAFLPFLYDEAAAKVRQSNRGFIAKPRVVGTEAEATPAA
ncbi:MAG: 2OG-Fe(II) oxygenase [Rhizobiaceae bacterium]|nr:2OG-Fe(II) oxygenase [Rhizobiaceae bacterium]